MLGSNAFWTRRQLAYKEPLEVRELELPFLLLRGIFRPGRRGPRPADARLRRLAPCAEGGLLYLLFLQLP
ncbi:MAG TPA: hypothetical protein VJ547_09315 [Candidatus Thermoplasmatota archaeon]|nr:hypothetical protein [Candidatus Thermoplasmatota archaeon]